MPRSEFSLLARPARTRTQLLLGPLRTLQDEPARIRLRAYREMRMPMAGTGMVPVAIVGVPSRKPVISSTHRFRPSSSPSPPVPQARRSRARPRDQPRNC